MIRFLLRLFGISPAKNPSVAKPAPAAGHSAVLRESPPPGSASVFLGWQEMIDGDGRIAGYLLQPRATTPGSLISGKDLVAALVQENAARIAGRRPVILPLDGRQWAGADFRPVAAPQMHFLLEGQASLFPEEIARIQTGMVATGSRLAARANPQAPLPARTDLLVLDFRAQPLSALERAVPALRTAQPGLNVAAIGIESWTEHRLCLSMGFHFTSGPFASRPDDTNHCGLGQNRMVLLEMLNALRSEADSAEIATSAKRDPAVVLKLLEMANSPLYGLARKVANIEEAIMLMGRDALYRWLTLAMFRMDGDNGRDLTLLVLASCRAAFMEALGREKDVRTGDELFLVGLLSLMDSLLGLPMVQVLAKMNLAEDVVSVLRNSEGPLVRYLTLAIAMERCQPEKAINMASALGIGRENLLQAWRHAKEQANSLLAD